MIASYEAFVGYVEQKGWLYLSDPKIEGVESLSGLTRGGPWYTGEDGDPWIWKDRAAEGNRLAYGSMLGGRKGFVAPSMYAEFYALFRPDQTVEERYKLGRVTQTALSLYKLFEDSPYLPTHDIRRRLGVSKKTGASRVDAAMAALHRTFELTAAGTAQRLDRFGRPYGWASTVQALVEEHIPSQWLNRRPDADPAARILGAYPDADPEALASALLIHEAAGGSWRSGEVHRF